MSNDLVIGMAGAGGDGIVSAGESLINAVARQGYYAILTKSFGPQIRGGESSCRLRVATEPVRSSGDTLDIAIALSWDDFLKFGAELPVGGRTTLVFESESGLDARELTVAGVRPAETLAVPIAALSKQATGAERSKNAVVMGLLSTWLGVSGERIVAGIRRKLGKKGDEVVAANERAFAAGASYAVEHPLKRSRKLEPPQGAASEGEPPPKVLADGNEMSAAGAIFAGCEFFGGYPITPSSEIMHYLNHEIWKYGGSLLQAEDEIAGIGAVVGASFAGKKALTATSGPGMSLKTEMLGLATIAELPLVCVNVQRGGPSTGIPTKSEQADLFQAVFSSHGDAPRPVLAPSSVAESFTTTVEAFEIAETYQTPVIILSDQEIAQRKETFDPIDTSVLKVVSRRVPVESELEHYVRFRINESGVSPISHPGMAKGNYLASGIEHNESGAPTAGGEMHERMVAKRTRKLNPLKQQRGFFAIEGDPSAPLALVAWGSVAGIARESLERARADGLRVKLLVPRLLYPVAEEVYQDFFTGVRAGLVVEQSYQGQLYRLIRMYVDAPHGLRSFAKPGSNPILAGEIVERLLGLAAELQRQRQNEVEPQE